MEGPGEAIIVLMVAMAAIGVPATATAEQLGVVWTTYTAEGNGASLASIDAVSPSDVWSVGLKLGGGICQYETLIEHWNGGAWSVNPSPNVSASNTTLAGVAALSSTNAWAVGGYRPQGGGSLQPLIVHWNGSAWQIARIPDVGAFATLDAVDRRPTGGLWAGGYRVDVVASTPVLLHRTRRGWSTAPPPPGTDIFDLAVVGDQELWTVSGSRLAHAEPS